MKNEKSTGRALITGMAGFAGSHLAAYLVSRGWEVAGIERHGVSQSNLVELTDKVSIEECDILSPKDVGEVIRRYRPTAVFHLAGTSYVPTAQNAPQLAFEVNVKGSLNVMEETVANAPGARFILISSAEVYGQAPPESMPLTEDHPPSPANIYALTKLCAEETALYYSSARELDTVILRPFNHIGPGQRPSFVTASFALQIALIEAGKKPPVMEVGNLRASRDFTDVRDMVRAYHLAALRCEKGLTYNISSGRAYTIEEILERLLEKTQAKIEVRTDPKRLRGKESQLFRGDSSRFSNQTGWRAEFDIDRTLEEILHYWRGRAGII